MSNKILNLNKGGYNVDFSWLSDLENIIIKKFNLRKQISIALLDKTEIKQLNRVYRKKDKLTDVLSFEINSDHILGEVLICPEQAHLQARQNKKTYKSELQLLLVHGILHLLGYDHEKSYREELRQQRMETEILEKLKK